MTERFSDLRLGHHVSFMINVNFLDFSERTKVSGQSFFLVLEQSVTIVAFCLLDVVLWLRCL